MRLSPKAMAMSWGVLWSGAVLSTGLVNLARPRYGRAFLEVVSSVYPGFENSRTAPDVISGSAIALLDGAVAGLVFGWLYNSFNRCGGPGTNRGSFENSDK